MPNVTVSDKAHRLFHSSSVGMVGNCDSPLLLMGNV